MPLFEYTCDNCKHHEEVMRTMTDGPPKKCSQCKKPVNQTYGAPSLQIGGYSPMHPRKLRGNRGNRAKTRAP